MPACLVVPRSGECGIARQPRCRKAQNASGCLYTGTLCLAGTRFQKVDNVFIAGLDYLQRFASSPEATQILKREMYMFEAYLSSDKGGTYEIREIFLFCV